MNMSLVYFLIGIITLSIAIWVIGSYTAVKGIEQPKFSVVLKEKGYEIRQYTPYIVAEVTVFGKQRAALKDAFRLLAGYIFGGNTSQESLDEKGMVVDIKKSEKISMTSPVIDTSGANSQHIVQFTMPSSYTLDSLPIPDDKRVSLVAKKGAKIAALRFTGWATERKTKSKIKQLEALLKRDFYTPSGPFSLAQYNPPFSFPLMRRNEILVEIN